MRSLALAVIGVFLCAIPGLAEFRSYAVVQQDASLISRTESSGCSASISLKIASFATRVSTHGIAVTVRQPRSIPIQGFVTCRKWDL